MNFIWILIGFKWKNTMFPTEAFRITSRDLGILRYIQNTCTFKFLNPLCDKEHEKNCTILFIHLRRYAYLVNIANFVISSNGIITQQLEIASVYIPFLNNSLIFQGIWFNVPPVSGLQHFKILLFGL